MYEDDWLEMAYEDRVSGTDYDDAEILDFDPESDYMEDEKDD